MKSKFARIQLVLWPALFLSTALLLVGQERGVTTPEEEFGHEIGADYTLINFEQLHSYWAKLASESDRVVLDTIGLTAEGRPHIQAVITSPANHGDIDRYREIAARIAKAKGVDEEEAFELAADGKAIVWIGRRTPRLRGARSPAAHRNGLPARRLRGSRDPSHPGQRHRSGHPRQPRRSRALRQLVHATGRSSGAHDRRRPGSLPEVRRPRQQPRLLHGGARGNAEHEPLDVPRVVPADCLQPPPDRTVGHGHVRPALPGSAEPLPRSSHHHQSGSGGLGHAPSFRARRQGRHDDAFRRLVLDLVERRVADDSVFQEHDRAAYRDHRPPDPDRDPVHRSPTDAARRLAPTGRTRTLALPAVRRILADGELGGAGLRGPELRPPALQRLADGDELHRARQSRLMDHASLRAGSARRLRPAPGDRTAWEETLRDPADRDREASSSRRIRRIFRRPPSSSTRSSTAAWTFTGRPPILLRKARSIPRALTW